MASSAVEVFCLHMKQYANKSFHRSEKIKIILYSHSSYKNINTHFVMCIQLSSKLKVELGGPRGRAAKSAVS